MVTTQPCLRTNKWFGKGPADLFLLLVYLGLVSQTTGGKILMYPFANGFNSRLMDMRLMASILQERGHHITILINSEDRRAFQAPGMDFEIYEFPTPSVSLRMSDEEYRHKVVFEPDPVELIKIMTVQQLQYCENLLSHPGLLVRLKGQNFDLFVVDFAENCGRVLKDFLDIPTIVLSTNGFSIDPVFFPNLPSIVALPNTGMPEKMSLRQRFANTFFTYAAKVFINPTWYGSFDKLRGQYGLNSSLLVEESFKDCLVLCGTDFVFEFPRPLLPNVVTIGGWSVEPRKELPPKLADFLKDVNKDGFIVVSFGTLAAQLNKNIIAMFVELFSQIPHKVIWSFKGTLPENISSNVLVSDWIPQSDLLAQPMARLFISHCGFHSTMESIWNAVPILAVPLFADQFDNALRLTERVKMAVSLKVKEFSSGDLSRAFNQLLQEEKYKNNAQKASSMLRDKPVSPKEKMVYHVEFVIRHKGVPHLWSKTAQSFSVLELYSVDVVLILIGILLIVVFIIFFILRCLLKLLCKVCSRKTIKEKSH